jgi:hypothetical protein
MKEQKKYKVIRDCQDGEFGMGRNYTIEQWREQAIEWADSDGNDKLIKELKKMSKKEIIDTISEIWQLEFTECVPQLAYNWNDNNEIANTFFEILNTCEFKLEKVNNEYHLHDLQGANLGDIEDDTFEKTRQVIERIDTYINDYFANDLQECLDIEEYGDYEDLLQQAIPLNKQTDGEFDFDLKVLDFIINAPDTKLADIDWYIKGDKNGVC